MEKPKAPMNLLKRYVIVLLGLAVGCAGASIFIMVAGTLSIRHAMRLQASDQVKLPPAKSAPPAPREDRLVLDVTLEGLILEGKSLSLAELETAVRSSGKKLLLIRAEKRVPYQDMRTILETIGRAGIGKITFSVVDDKDAKSTSAETHSDSSPANAGSAW